MVGVVFSDFGWNNNPGTLHSKASYLEVLVVLKTTSSNHSLWERWMMRTCCFGESQGTQSYITVPIVSRSDSIIAKQLFPQWV
jgi:hypothetical protein